MTRSGMVYATSPDRRLVAVTDEKGFTVLDLDHGQVDVGDTLTSDVEGTSWFNKTRGLRLIAYPKAKGVHSSALRELLFPKSATYSPLD